MKAGSLREAMPNVAAFIDDMRDTFGADVINAQIRRGMKGEPGFWASENGHEIGCKMPPARHEVTAAQMVLNPTKKET